MAISRQKKEEILQEVSSVIGDAESMVFVNFHGLSVDDANKLRKELSQKGVNYRVAKKSLLKRAFDGSDVKGQMPELEGELAIAWGSDPVVPAGSIYAFQKSLDGAVSILGGVFEGEYKNQEDMMMIAQIPPLEVLRGMFVNLINSPIQRTAIVLGQIAEKKAA